ncbi:MAG: hypothetical protein ACK5ZC_01535 [Pirellulaceae bacterium]
MPKKQIQEVSKILTDLFTVPAPSLGIDIDGCVDESPIFFRLLTKCWPGKVYVISFRSDRAKAEADLAKYHIRYDELILVASLESKAEVIQREGILGFFDDQPEVLKGIDATTSVMLVRNGGNFDFEDRRWMFSEATGKQV